MSWLGKKTLFLFKLIMSYNFVLLLIILLINPVGQHLLLNLWETLKSFDMNRVGVLQFDALELHIICVRTTTRFNVWSLSITFFSLLISFVEIQISLKLGSYWIRYVNYVANWLIPKVYDRNLYSRKFALKDAFEGEKIGRKLHTSLVRLDDSFTSSSRELHAHNWAYN